MRVRDLVFKAASVHSSGGCEDLAVSILGRYESGGATSSAVHLSESAAHVLDGSSEAARAQADDDNACSLDDDVRTVREKLEHAAQLFVLDENGSVVAVLSKSGTCGEDRPLHQTHSKQEVDRIVDEASEESFPASDPPGYSH